MRQAGAKLQTCILSTSPPGKPSRRLLFFPAHVTEEETEAQGGLAQVTQLGKSQSLRTSFLPSLPRDARPWLCGLGPRRPAPGPGRLWDPGAPVRGPFPAGAQVAEEGAHLPPHPVAGAVPRHPPGMPLHSCGGGVAACGRVCRRRVPVAKQGPAPGAESAGPAAPAPPPRSTGKVVAGGRTKLYFPRRGAGAAPGLPSGDTVGDVRVDV